MSNETNRPGEPPYGPGAGGPWGMGGMGPMSMWVAPWLQMMRFWSDAMTSFTPQQGQEWSPLNPWGSGTTTGSTPPVAVSVRVKSKREARVTVDVDPGADHRRLSVRPLKHLEKPTVKEIAGVTIESRPGRVTVSLEIADRQTAGSYVGAVEDAQGYRRGEVRLEVVD